MSQSNRSGRTGVQLVPFTLLTPSDLPPERQQPPSDQTLRNLASAINVPIANLRTAVCFITPEDIIATQYQQWTRHQQVHNSVHTVTMPTNEFMLTYGEQELRGFRVSMAINGFPFTIARVAWDASVSNDPPSWPRS